MESLGKFTGEKIVAPILERRRKKIEQFNLEISGQENLQELKERQFLLVANHLMPVDATDQQSQLSPDAFVLERIVHDLNNQELKIVSKADDGWWAENLYKYFQKHIGQPFGKGLSKGLGFIPVFKNPGSFNRDFVKVVDNTIQEGKNPILFFPEGHWYEDFDPEHQLESGVASIARKYGLVILPVYIKGARSWQPNTEVQISFGQSFVPGQLSKEEITEQIRLRLRNLQEDLAKNIKNSSNGMHTPSSTIDTYSKLIKR